jgi:hypothetical protein
VVFKSSTAKEADLSLKVATDPAGGFSKPNSAGGGSYPRKAVIKQWEQYKLPDGV